MQDAGKQLELPLSRDAKFEITHRLRNRAPALISRTIQKNMASLLEQIELSASSNGWCDRGQEVLAAKLDVDVRSFRRWKTLAIDLELIETHPGPGLAAPELLRVNWATAARLSKVPSSFQPPESKVVQQDAPIAHDPSPEAVPKDGKNVRCDRTNVRSHHLPFVESSKETISPFTIKDGEESLVTQTPDICPVRPDIFLLSLADLGNADRLDEWFDWASATNRVRRCDRHRVFALARSISRRAKAAQATGKEGPGVGAFLTNVRHRNWFAAGDDEDWARRALQYLDRQESGL